MTNFNNFITRICQNNFIILNIICFLSGFCHYFCCYAYRKPFLAATFEGLSLWGVEYKIVLIAFEVIGYTISKFYGIKFVPEVSVKKRGIWIVSFISVSEVFLIIFALIPYPYNFVALFFNGLCLGQLWGLTFSFLEGRKCSELFASGMAMSTIISSGAIKSFSKALLMAGVNQFWMPTLVGGIFFIPLLFFIFVLESLPDPDEEDIDTRTERVAMDGEDRCNYLKFFGPGVVVLTTLYVFIASYRDLRDNFGVELFAGFGVNENASIFAISEIIVGLFICIPVAIFMFIKMSIWNLVAYHALIWIGLTALLICTILYNSGAIPGMYFMVMSGMCVFTAELPYNSILGDLLIALFKYKANSGLFMYITDSFGYMSSIIILFIKNFGSPDLSWVDFFLKVSYIMTICGLSLSIFSITYFIIKYRNYKKNVQDEEPLKEIENRIEIDPLGNEAIRDPAKSNHRGSSVDESSEIEFL